MRKARWILACLAIAAAVVVAGCQPTTTTTDSGDTSNTPSTGQTAATQPGATEGVETVVLNAKGMH